MHLELLVRSAQPIAGRSRLWDLFLATLLLCAAILLRVFRRRVTAAVQKQGRKRLSRSLTYIDAVLRNFSDVVIVIEGNRHDDSHTPHAAGVGCAPGDRRLWHRLLLL
jgi:hypothetical protein